MIKGASKWFSVTIAIAIIFLIGAQAITFFMVNSKITQLEGNFSTFLEQTDSTNKEIQAKIAELSESLKSLSSEQSTIQSQVSQLKATTSADFSGIIETEIQGVATIATDAAQGTGFIISDDGYVVTNAHVLSGAAYAKVYTYDGTQHPAQLIGYNLILDIALLKISGSYHALQFEDSDNLRIGEKVIALGNPLGLSFSVTEGIISATDRQGTNGYNIYIQTDAALSPGNSGGPLLNTNGKVIGINNFKMSGGENLGFALESNHAVKTINEISNAILNITLI